MMRLTLRTLIAWLDDTLTPSEVRVIGMQVAESPFAKDLVDRLQRVTRQRRLTYPGDLSTEETDPNLVACYLDNALNPEQVAEYEKRCLTSDVHLAEVASVHQILSLIGQKAKVPGDAKARMYRLVRGRESTKPLVDTKQRPLPVKSKAASIDPVGPWGSDPSAKKSLVERFGPAAAVLAAIALLLWAASYSLNPEPAKIAVALKDVPGPQPDPVPPTVLPKAVERIEKVSPLPATTAKNETAKPAESQGSEAVATFEAIQGVVLKANPEANGWDRVEPKAALKVRSHLLNLAPFRNTLKLGKDEIDLVDSTDVFLSDSEKDQNARLELGRGHVVLRTGQGSPPFFFRFDGRSFSVTPGTGVIVGIELQPTLLPGQSEAAPLRVRFFVPEGRISLKAGDQDAVVDGPAEISMSSSGIFGEKGRQPIPAWVTETAPSGFDKEVGNQFVALLRPGRPILSDLVEAMDDPQKDVKRMAVLALGSIGSMEQVVEVVSRKEDALVHRAGVEVLRLGLANGGETAKVVRAALVRQFDQPWAEISEKLIVGYRPEDAKDDAILAKLVDYLSTAPSRGTRQLSLDNLRVLTGRDTLEYDPDSPEGKGLRAWQDLVRKKDSAKEGRPSASGLR